MRKWTIIITFSAFIFACGNTDTSGNDSTAADKDPLELGHKIYKQRCIACHGVAGDMGAAGAFNLTTSALSIEEKMLVITNGRNTMPIFEGVLSEKEIAAVAVYTETLKKK